MLRMLFYGFWGNVVDLFRGYNLLWQVLAITLTCFLAVTGFDWWYFLNSRSHVLFALITPALIVGALLPMFGLFILYFAARKRNNARLMLIACALGQAALIGWLISSSYKAFTGRVHPVLFDTTALLDISREFQFGFMRGGIFWGWPSSHTTVAFAMAMVLVQLYPRNKKIHIFAWLYAFYIGLGVSVSVHWFSEFAAGAIFGTLIGAVVGKSFRRRLRANAG